MIQIQMMKKFWWVISSYFKIDDPRYGQMHTRKIKNRQVCSNLLNALFFFINPILNLNLHRLNSTKYQQPQIITCIYNTLTETIRINSLHRTWRVLCVCKYFTYWSICLHARTCPFVCTLCIRWTSKLFSFNSIKNNKKAACASTIFCDIFFGHDLNWTYRDFQQIVSQENLGVHRNLTMQMQ